MTNPAEFPPAQGRTEPPVVQPAPAQPAYPQQAYAQPAYPAPAGPGAPATPRTGNPLGLVSVIIGGAVLVLGLVFLIIQAGVIAGGQYDALAVVNIANSLVSGLLGLAGLVIGAIGLAQKGRPKGLAGIGVGIGVAVVVGILSGLIYTTLISIWPR